VTLALSASGGGATARIGERLPAAPDTPVTLTADVSGVPNGSAPDRSPCPGAPRDVTLAGPGSGEGAGFGPFGQAAPQELAQLG
jgi:hypothetical protein